MSCERKPLDAEIVDLIDVYGGPEFEITYPDGARVAYVVSMFGCRLRGGVETPQLEEVSRLGWFPRTGALKLPRPPDMHRIVADAFDWRASTTLI